MPFSLHSHSAQFCKHARNGSLEEVVQAAMEVGFSHFGLSEHVPRYYSSQLYPEEEEAAMSPEDLVSQFDGFVAEARRLQISYEGRVKLLVGAETEFFEEDPTCERMKQLRERHALDYIVASVHHARNMPIDFDQAQFDAAAAKLGSEQLLCDYFDHQLRLIEELRPEVVGHFDVVRKYCPKVKFTGRVEERVRRNLQACVQYGCLVEVNSSGIAKRQGKPYPQEDVVKMACELGVRFTLSDDAHAPEDVGLYYGRLRQYIYDCGIGDRIYGLERCASGGVQQVHVGDIMEHSFWGRHPSYELNVS